MENNDLEVIKLRAMVISLSQLVNEKNYIVSCCWPCRNGADCMMWGKEIDSNKSLNRLQTHIKCNIKAYNPDQIVSLFSKYAKRLYETNGYLSYDDGTLFQLFKFEINKVGYWDYEVKINDLGYFGYANYDYSNFIDVLADLMQSVLCKIDKCKEHVKWLQEYNDKNNYEEERDLTQYLKDITNIDDIVKKYLVINEPIISINDNLLKL